MKKAFVGIFTVLFLISFVGYADAALFTTLLLGIELSYISEDGTPVTLTVDNFDFITLPEFFQVFNPGPFTGEVNIDGQKVFIDVGTTSFININPNSSSHITCSANGTNNVVCEQPPVDSDADGLGDYAEVNLHYTNPNNRDSDADGLGDYAEVNVYGTNPNIPDSDGDTIDDLLEIRMGTEPTLYDTDGDGDADNVDQCPTLFDVGANVFEGCPRFEDFSIPLLDQPDADADGFPDAHDACPDMPGERFTDPAFSGLRSIGCPFNDIDYDGDGFMSLSDFCPTEFGGALSEPVGCPANPILSVVTPPTPTFTNSCDVEPTGALSCFIPEEIKKKKSGGGGCSGDCEPPTLGKLDTGRQYVTGGFSFNGNTVDSTGYHTEYPLIVTLVNKPNLLAVKVYENYGPDNIMWVQFGLGMEEAGNSMNSAESSVLVKLERQGINVEEIELTDPNNILKNVSATTATVQCNQSSGGGGGGPIDECLLLGLRYTHTEAPIYNVVGVNVVDFSRNGQNFYFNDGYDVLGESLNPAPTADVAAGQAGKAYPEKRGLVELVRIDKDNDIWQDKFGFEWQKDDYGFKIISNTVPEHKTWEQSTSHGYDRNNPYFNSYKQWVLDRINEKYGDYYKISNPNMVENEAVTFSYDLAELNGREHPDFDKIIQYEQDRATITLEEYFDEIYLYRNPLK